MDTPEAVEMVRLETRAVLRQIGAILDFAEQRIGPLIEAAVNGPEKPPKRVMAIIFNVQRLQAWAHSLKVLNSDQHYQAIAAAGRSMFEIFVDITILFRDESGREAERYFAYQIADHYHSAEQIVTFSRDRRIKPELFDPLEMKAFLANPDVIRAKDTALQLWSEKEKRSGYPVHWSGIPNLQQRAIKLGTEFEIWYQNAYPFFSWFVHSGSSGNTKTPTPDYMEICRGAYILSESCFRQSLRALALAANLTAHDPAILTDLEAVGTGEA